MRKVMKKTIRKKLLTIFAAFTFAILMTFSITTSINGTDFSLSGMKTLASGSSDICNTWSEISKECLGIPTNCLCEIIVDP